MDTEAVQLEYRARLRRGTAITAAIIIGLDFLAVIAVLLLVK